MIAYLRLLGLLLLGAVGAFAAQLLLEDPGSVRILFRGWRVELTAVTALALLAAALAAVAILVAAWGAARRIGQRRVMARAARGALALLEGRHAEAERSLAGVPLRSPLGPPARIAAARAARARGRNERAERLLAPLAADPDFAPQIRAERAAWRLRAGAHAEAIALLEGDRDRLSPAAQRTLALALAANGRAEEALERLPGLAAVLGAERLEALELRLRQATLGSAPDREALERGWRRTPPAMRRQPALVLVRVERLVAFGAEPEAAAEIEDFMVKLWDDRLALRYARLESVPLERRLRFAESWLEAHPERPAALTALGALCRAAQLWGKAEDCLRRALAAGAGAEAWEELARLHLEQHDRDGALLCLQNALAALRQQGGLKPPARLLRRVQPEPQPERRSAFGLPHLAGDA